MKEGIKICDHARMVCAVMMVLCVIGMVMGFVFNAPKAIDSIPHDVLILVIWYLVACAFGAVRGILEGMLFGDPRPRRSGSRMPDAAFPGEKKTLC